MIKHPCHFKYQPEKCDNEATISVGGTEKAPEGKRGMMSMCATHAALHPLGEIYDEHLEIFKPKNREEFRALEAKKGERIYNNTMFAGSDRFWDFFASGYRSLDEIKTAFADDYCAKYWLLYRGWNEGYFVKKEADGTIKIKPSDDAEEENTSDGHLPLVTCDIKEDFHVFFYNWKTNEEVKL